MKKQLPDAKRTHALSAGPLQPAEAPDMGGSLRYCLLPAACGAGRATCYSHSPAILLGLENIAEEGWIRSDALTGLVAHEMGHLVHYRWRGEYDLPGGSGPWWQLYEEGFAQRCEHVLCGEHAWHMPQETDRNDWLDWCQENRGWLAAEFLRRADAAEDIRPFFGSWFELRGRKQCGYFLGHELIRQLEISKTLKEIALLDDMEGQLRHILQEVAEGDT